MLEGGEDAVEIGLAMGAVTVEEEGFLGHGLLQCMDRGPWDVLFASALRIDRVSQWRSRREIVGVYHGFGEGGAFSGVLYRVRRGV
jgi:hypothetical protein